MGIWDILTKPLKLTSAVFNWQEPMGFRLSLRGDLLIRLGVALTVWAAVSGLFWLIFAFLVKPPELAVAMFVAVFIGLVPACLALFLRRNHVSGSIWIYDDHLIRQRSYVSIGFFGSWSEVSEWPNETISRCLIIPALELGKSFSVMLLTVDSNVEMVGIPEQINLKELARHFTEAGITVEKRDSIPSRYTQGFSPKVFTVMSVVGALLFSIGLGFNIYRVPRAGQRIAVRENRPNIQPNFPRPVRPVQTLPNPIERDTDPTEQESAPDLPIEKPNPPRPGFMRNPPVMPSNQVPNQSREQLRNRIPNGPGAPRSQPDLPTAKPNPPKPSTQEPPASNGNDSKLIGNPEGGFPFRMVNRQGETLLGFKYSIGNWAGEPAVRNLTPLYDRSPSSGRVTAIVAKDGYAVGGLKIDAPKYVSAVQIVFQRIKPDGQLDPGDAYTSEWIGEPSEKEAPTVDGAGKKAIGIHGRRGAIIDALGLVFE